MSSLIFKRDFENPHFRKLDSIVNFQTPQISLPTSPTSSITRSDQPSPHASLKPSPMSNFHKHKASLPNLKHGFENLTELSTPKSKVQVIPISNLYTDRSNGHSRSKSDLPPLLSCRNYNAPLVSALRIKEPYTARNHVEVQHFSPREHVEQVKHEKDPFEHKKLLNYLDYLERNNQIDLKQKLKPKAKKGSPTKSKKSLDTSNINSSRVHTTISMESIKDRSVSKGPTTKLFESNLYDSSSSRFNNRSLAKSPSNLNLVTRENTIDVSLAIKEVATKNRVINRFVKQTTEKKLYRNSFEPMFKVIAQNLNEIYGVFMNEKKVISVLETLSEKNPKLLELVSAKSHKIVNYDTHKLEQRFAMVEIVNETLSIPVRLEKMKQGVILVEPSIIKELTAFNERLEEYIIKKKRDQLKLIEDRLIQTEDNLQNLFSKKTTEMRQKNRLKQYTEAKAIISERPKLGFYYFTADNPVQVVETHLQEHGELKNIKAKNLEHARGLQEVFASWRQHIGKT